MFQLPYLTLSYHQKRISAKIETITYWITPKWPNTTMPMYPSSVLLVSPSPKCHPISLYNQPFRSYNRLCDKCTKITPKWLCDKCTRMTPKWRWTLQGPIRHLIYVSGVIVSQISIGFALKLAVSEKQHILRQVHRITSLTKAPHICTTSTPTSSFQSVSLYDLPSFLDTGPFDTTWPSNP